MPSPAKPWENGVESAKPVSQPITSTSNTNQPELPSRSNINRLNQQYNTGINTGYTQPGQYGGAIGGIGYNSFGGGIGYGNTFGGMGYNSGYGNYGSRFGGQYGGAYTAGYQMNNRFGQPYGQMGYPENQMSYVQQMEQATQPTFQTLESIVQTFGSFAQMLESTFFATHSSFMAMVGVADQLSSLRLYLQNLLSIARIWKLVKRLWYRMMGEVPPVDPGEISLDGFNEFQARTNKPSKKPLFIFFAMLIGIPYLLSKLLKKVNSQIKLPKDIGLLTPSEIVNLEFCKAEYDFNSDSLGDLSFKKGELVAVVDKGQQEEGTIGWWTGRTSDGRIGIFPNNYVKLIPKVAEKEKESSPVQYVPK